MSAEQIRKVWLGIGLVFLIATYPSWINGRAGAASGYDAPWVYPSLNPAVQH